MMLNMAQTMLTPRKLEALVAAYFGQWPGEKFCYVKEDGTPHFVRSTNMGGATGRMVEDLQKFGYLTKRSWRLGEDGEPKANQLTVKGYDAIITHVGGASRLGRLIDPKELEQRRADREAFEQERDRRRAERIERERIQHEENVAKRNRETARAARTILADYEGRQLDQLPDDELLAFVDKIATL